MTAASLFKGTPANGLQPVDPSRHLGSIAELIELCFRADLDAAGRSLIREMRWLSRAGPALRLVQAATLGRQPWNLGFVWVEQGRVVGTVSTQRAGSRSKNWLIANVAVHPDHRRRGIALALMRATLDLIRSEGGTAAILQVDDDNTAAVNLYRRLGFNRVTTQTTWVRPGRLLPPPLAPPGSSTEGANIRLRGAGEWQAHYALASRVRPEGLTWAHPLQADDLRPGLGKRLESFLLGRVEEHWVAEPARRSAAAPPGLAGALTLQIAGPEGDRLILLVDPQYRGQVERPLIVRGLRRIGRRPWGTRLDHPTDDAQAAGIFRELGFQARRVLRWMRAELR